MWHSFRTDSKRSFLQAFHHFSSRRELPSKMISDNAKHLLHESASAWKLRRYCMLQKYYNT